MPAASISLISKGIFDVSFELMPSVHFSSISGRTPPSLHISRNSRSVHMSPVQSVPARRWRSFSDFSSSTVDEAIAFVPPRRLVESS